MKMQWRGEGRKTLQCLHEGQWIHWKQHPRCSHVAANTTDFSAVSILLAMGFELLPSGVRVEG